MKRWSNTFFGGVLLSLLLAGCMQGSPPVAPVADPSADTISGTVANWPGGTATVQPVATDETGTVVLRRLDASATVSEDGSFQLALPQTVGSELLTSEPICLGSFQGSVAPQEWGEFFAEVGVFQADQYVGALVLATTPDIYVAPQVGDMVVYRLFLDRAVTVQGTCSEQGFVQRFDAAGEPGWNYVVFEVQGVSPEGFPNAVQISTPEVIPAGVEWYFLGLQEALQRR